MGKKQNALSWFKEEFNAEYFSSNKTDWIRISIGKDRAVHLFRQSFTDKVVWLCNVNIYNATGARVIRPINNPDLSWIEGDEKDKTKFKTDLEKLKQEYGDR